MEIAEETGSMEETVSLVVGAATMALTTQEPVGFA